MWICKAPARQLHSKTHCCLWNGHTRKQGNSLTSSISKKVGTRCGSPSYGRFSEGCSSPVIRRAPSRHSGDARVYGHTTSAMHKLRTPPPLARLFYPYCPSERDIANKHTSHHSTVSSAQAALGTLFFLPVAPTYEPLISAPVTWFSCILPCASVAGGVSRPRSGALLTNTRCFEV